MLKIYKASAGSGKTYALTRQYLTLLLGKQNPETGEWKLRSAKDDAHRHILAITFTNKATQEMTRRIISQLAILAGREPGQDSDTKSPYLKEFCDLFNTDEESLAKLSSDILDELLADFAFFHVSTIDAFFQNVLHIFAREIEMPDNFRLELENSSTISLGVNEMFASLNRRTPADPLRQREQKWLTQWLTRHMIKKLDDGKAVNLLSRNSSLYSDLIDTFNKLLDETFQINSEIITQYLDRIEYLAAFEKGLKERVSLKEADLRAQAVALKQYGDYKNINNHIRTRIEQWAVGDMKAPSNTIHNAVNNQDKRFIAAYRKNGVDPGIDAAVTSLCETAVHFEQQIMQYLILSESITPLGLLGCLLRHISSFCKDNNVILLSNTNSLLREIINDDDTPFVYERLGYYLRHFLIDEVQDTSRMQWDNLRPLIMESLGNNHENLVIGDEKQCIYRFRNSDPELLNHIIADNIIDNYGPTAVVTEGNTIEQNNNWRSSAEVVKFNNSIFHALAKISGADDVYSNVIQQINPKRKAVNGYVKMIFEKADTETNKSINDDENVDKEKLAFGSDATVNEVRRLLSAGYKPNQIAVLVRKHSEGEAIINRLLHCHESPDWPHGPIDVKSTDAVGLKSSATIRMIIEILRLTQLPHIVPVENTKNPNEIKTKENPAYRRARLLYCYQYYLNTSVQDDNGNMRPRSTSEAIALAIDAVNSDENVNSGNTNTNIPPGTPSLREIINFATSSTSGINSDSTETETITCLTLSAIVDKIISRYVIPEVLPKETAFLTAFQDVVYDFCSQGTSDIRAFLDWWDRGGCNSSLSSTAESNAVNVMTIHQSKGLEFPCVILPFCNMDMVTYSDRFRKSYNWMPLDPNDFPGIAPEVIPPMVPIEFKSDISKIDIFKKDAERIKKEQLVDALNVCYVAFTRAVNELIVIAPKESSKASEPLNKKLRAAVEWLSSDNIKSDTSLNDKCDWVLPLLENFNNDTIEIGTPTIPQQKEEVKSDDNCITLPNYNPEVNDQLVTLTAADIDFFDFNDPRHRGNFMHNVLSKVRHRNDLNRALRRAAVRARLTPDQTESCKKVLEPAINDPKVDRWFEGYSNLYLEQSIVNTGIDRRPDRIVVLDDGSVEIIDYKFGDDHPSYTSQVRRYMKLLNQAGYSNVRGYLWFIPSNTIRPITP